MENAKVKYTGKKNFHFQHGSVSFDFKPGEVKEVSQAEAEVLLREKAIVRNWNKKDGTLEGQTEVSLFELFVEEKSADQGDKTKGANK